MNERLISEGSCGTGVMAAEDSALASQEYITHFKIYSYRKIIFNVGNTLQYY